MQKPLMLLLLLLVGSYGLQAQQDQRLAATKTPLYEVERLQLPSQDNKDLLEAELARRGPGIAPRFAQTMEVDVSPITHGNWEVNNGKAVWRLRVPSPGAKSLNLGFDEFFMPEGGSLIIYSSDYQMIQGPFTPADNEAHEQLWTPIVIGDELVIEVSLPEVNRDDLRLHLKSVNHDFLGFADAAASGSCNIDVVCGLADGFGIIDQYRDIIQSVAVYSTGGSTFCTGFLISSTRQDCTPFFMTADHCGIGPGNAASLVTYWNFQNSECRTPGSPASGAAGDGQLNDFNTGAIHRASYSPADATLVELDDPVSETADAWFAGWDATENLEQDTLIGIHHPSTDEKRISFQFDGVYRGEWGSNETPVPDGDHIIVEDWNMGTTEGGSSGSPIFDSNKRVVGQLHGGFAACGNDEYDTYGWFPASWVGGGTPATRLSDWLDPDNTGTLVLDGRPQIQCSFFAGATPQNQSLCASEDAEYTISVSESFIGTVNLTLDGLPAELTATFGQENVMPGGSTTLSITGTAALTTGVYTFTLLGSDGENTSNQMLALAITDDISMMPTLTTPNDMVTDQGANLTLVWEMTPNAANYEVELATDLAFENVIASGTGLTSENFSTPSLNSSTVYYWRVRAFNVCGTGDWSTIFSFETGAIVCNTRTATDLPVPVGPSNGSVGESNIEFDYSGIISSVRVINLDVKHTWIGDLNATLTSPNGTIDLFNRPDCNEPDILVSFEDGADQSSAVFEQTCLPTPPSITGTFEPAEALATFAGEDVAGSWTLAIRDNANQDGGQIEAWTLEVCTLISAEASVASSLENTTICAGNELVFNVTLGTGFEGEIELSASGLPAGAIINFDTNPAAPGTLVNGTIEGITELGSFDISVQADDGTTMATTSPVNLNVITAPDFTTLQSPINDASIAQDMTSFEWGMVDGVESYLLQIASDDTFTNTVLESEEDEINADINLIDGGLQPTEQYYWRVKAINECGESVSGFFNFVFQPLAIHELGNITLAIHPNPTTGPLQVSLSGDLGNSDLMIDAIAANGQKLKSWKLPAIAGQQNLDLSELPAGVYWLNITSGKLRAVEKIVLVR